MTLYLRAKFLKRVQEGELPKQVKINFYHYDVKAKKKEEPDFPNGLFELA